MPSANAAGSATPCNSGSNGLTEPRRIVFRPAAALCASPSTGPECIASAAISAGWRSATNPAMPAPADRPAM